MTGKLEEALSRLSTLPAGQQDEIAALILAEIDDETAWNESFSKSQKELGHLGDEALEEFNRGQTRPCD